MHGDGDDDDDVCSAVIMMMRFPNPIHTTPSTPPPNAHKTLNIFFLLTHFLLTHSFSMRSSNTASSHFSRNQCNLKTCCVNCMTCCCLKRRGALHYETSRRYVGVWGCCGGMARGCCGCCGYVVHVCGSCVPTNISTIHTHNTPQHRQLAGTLFNVLFNLPKFVQFEMSDPFVKKQEREEPQLSDWDRFARAEYIRYGERGVVQVGFVVQVVGKSVCCIHHTLKQACNGGGRGGQCCNGYTSRHVG